MINSFTILIPIYNEAENLERLESCLLDFFTLAIIPAKVLFIDDGSSDYSHKLIKQICSRNPKMDFVKLAQNSGISAALRAGLEQVNTKYVAYMDGDLQTSPHDFNLLIPHLEKYDLVNGWRRKRKDGFLKNVSSKWGNYIRNWFTHDGMHDTGCPLKIMKTQDFKTIPFYRGMHRFIPALFLLYHKKIIEIPVNHFPRTNGVSKFGIKNRMIPTFIDCFGYLWLKKRIVNYKVIK